MNAIYFLLTLTMNEALRGGKLLIIAVGSLFKGFEVTRAMITALLLDSLIVAVVHLDLSLNLRGSPPYLFRRLMFAHPRLTLL